MKREINEKKKLEFGVSLKYIKSPLTNNFIKVSSIAKTTFISQFNSFLNYLSFLLLPSVVVFNSTEAFLFTNSFILVLRAYWLIKYFSKLEQTRLDKVMVSISLLVWIVYHTNFMIFWILQKILVHDPGMKIQSQIVGCGFVTIFTVIIGGVVEVFKVVISLALTVKNLIMKIKRHCRKKRS